jgi:hypothetical protein
MSGVQDPEASVVGGHPRLTRSEGFARCATLQHLGSTFLYVEQATTPCAKCFYSLEREYATLSAFEGHYWCTVKCPFQ